MWIWKLYENLMDKSTNGECVAKSLARVSSCTRITLFYGPAKRTLRILNLMNAWGLSKIYVKKLIPEYVVWKDTWKINIALNLILLRRGAVLMRRVMRWDRKQTNARFSKQVEGVLNFVNRQSQDRHVESQHAEARAMKRLCANPHNYLLHLVR